MAQRSERKARAIDDPGPSFCRNGQATPGIWAT
ncbi:hypothetical protein SNOG_08147 [Parastagonospora nodorum SN15]|uniref:Uncharacterized protein n=1 Tax=Phaeosphaeria nodorum (strain SN15 / ATCC MYA-4574 / FGSC 10173) TaxID=321614 RepID=Q0UJB7_PHANO|nr:hypothetical protein SNOG_08147 [Parastagonospora nodorum SN15]EAT84423.1 hypothetical protein SNOG_08147 [Parastagonospora nodorum SN15]